MTTLVRHRLGELTMLVLDDSGALVDVRVHQPWRPTRVGEVVDGRITHVAKEMRAAFVDIGGDVAGFLPVKKNEQPLEGEAVRVEIVRDALEDKGPKLKRVKEGDAPAVSPVLRYLNGLPKPWVFDDPVVAAEVDAEVCGGLFASYGVEEAYDGLCNPRVGLSGGGSLIIESTAALTAIDVNSGAASALQANMAAAVEVARQIKLRNLSGLIVIDMITLKKPEPRGQVLAVLNDALQDDRAEVLGYTRGGTVEVLRSRQGVPLVDLVGSVQARALDALMAVLAEQHSTPAWIPQLKVDDNIWAALQGPLVEQRQQAEQKLGRKIVLLRMDFADLKGYSLHHD